MGNVDEIIWVPEKIILTDPATKTDSPLTQALVQTMSFGHISMALTKSESRRFDRLLGQSQKRIDMIYVQAPD